MSSPFSEPSSNSKLRVVKLGGSLLLCRDLARRWRGWLDRQPAAANLVLVGGGQVADAIRAADKVHALPAATAHALAIAAMSVTAQLAARLLPDAELLTTSGEYARWIQAADVARMGSNPVGIFDLGALCRSEPGHTEPWRDRFAAVEPSWDVTSDSLAAILAATVGAAELVLLKSTDTPPDATLGDLAANGYVDRCFPRASQGMNVRCVNLRAAEWDA